MSHHLNKEDRKAIDHYLKRKWKQIEIAKVLKRNKGVISKEINRNKDKNGIYHYGLAERKYRDRRKLAKQPQRKLVNDIALSIYVEKQLKNNRSPEQIAGRLRLEEQAAVICHETIYQWIYNERPDLQGFLCFKRSKFRRKRGTKKREKQRRLTQFRNIEARPVPANNRTRLGDWEGDTVIGKNKKQRILTHVDRKSGYGYADLLLIVSAEIIEDVTAKRFKSIPRNKRHTITYDRGSEFGGEDTLLERKTKTEVYRANAYSSWERGTNENWNGLIRRELPKGTDFAILTQADIDKIVYNLNHRPRKRLGYLTPYEVFVLEIDLVAFQTRI